MSYDINLVNPVTKDILELPYAHIMTGGTYAADYNEVTGQFTPKPITEAHLNITYNYSHYYRIGSAGDERFSEPSIRGIYGKTGAESIPMLESMIQKIEELYKPDGKWAKTQRHKITYTDNKTGKELHLVEIIAHQIPKGEYTKNEFDVLVDEGSTDDYWEATAANALVPLYQLLTMAKLRPDGVWEGD